jgi:para-aminobenzoate synthetase/4-amino-4-deoxychorismate lyase
VSSAQRRPDRHRGVFETLLVLDGEPVELGAHLARLDASLRALFPHREPPAELALELAEASTGTALGAIRAVVAPGEDETLQMEIARLEIEPQRILPPVPATIEARTVAVRGGLGGHKWADRSFLDRMHGGLADDETLLVLDWDDTLLESSRANAFAVLDGALLTPPADGRILPGIARARALDIAAEAGLEVRETALLREDLTTADELFLTGSLRGVELVRTVDGTELEPTGEVAAAIHDGLRRAWVGAGLDRVPRR